MFELLKNRNIFLLWSSRALSRFGDALESIALMYLVYDLTGSGLAMGTVMLFSVIPNIVVSPFAGVIADKYNKRRIMILAELARSSFILLIPVLMLFGKIELWHIYTISLLVSVAESFFVPCSGVVVRVVVKKEKLHLMNALGTTTNNIMRLLGYSIAGMAVVYLNKEILFAIDAGTFLFSAIAVFCLKVQDMPNGNSKNSFFTDLVDGFVYIKKIKLIPILFLGIVAVQAFNVPMTQFLPITLEVIEDLSPSWGGTLLTIMSLGSIGAGIIYPKLVEQNLKLKSVFIVGLPIIGVAMNMMFIYPKGYVTIVAFCVLGFFTSLIGMWSFTEIRKICDVGFLGRVGSITNIIILASVPLMSSICGALIDFVGIALIIRVCGALFICFGLIIYILLNKNEKVNMEMQEAN